MAGRPSGRGGARGGGSARPGSRPSGCHRSWEVHVLGLVAVLATGGAGAAAFARHAEVHVVVTAGPVAGDAPAGGPAVAALPLAGPVVVVGEGAAAVGEVEQVL